MSTLDLIRSKKDEIIALGEAYGYSNFRVFGSVARGEEDDKSDIDLLVDYDQPKELQETTWLDMDIGEKLSTLLRRKVDVVVARLLKPHYARFILPEAQAI